MWLAVLIFIVKWSTGQIFRTFHTFQNGPPWYTYIFVVHRWIHCVSRENLKCLILFRGKTLAGLINVRRSGQTPCDTIVGPRVNDVRGRPNGRVRSIRADRAPDGPAAYVQSSAVWHCRLSSACRVVHSHVLEGGQRPETADGLSTEGEPCARGGTCSTQKPKAYDNIIVVNWTARRVRE